MDNAENKAIFKTAFKGFEKKGVIEYISDLSAKSEEALAACRTEAENFKAMADDLQKKNAELMSKISAFEGIEEELTRLKNENDSLKLTKDELERKVSELSKKLETDFIPDKSRLEDEVESLRAELEKTKSQTERDKAVIADVLIKADGIAKKFQEDAINAANAQKEEIERQIISKKSELMGICGEIERMKNVFQDLYTRYVDNK